MLHVFTITDSTQVGGSLCQGVPVPKGVFSANTPLELLDEEGEIQPCHIKTLCLWPDKSVRWALIEGSLLAQTKEKAAYFLRPFVYKSMQLKRKWVFDDEASLNIQTAHARISVSKHEFLTIKTDNILQQLKLKAELLDDQLTLQSIETQYTSVYDQNNHTLFCKIEQEASFLNAQNKVLRKSVHLKIDHDSGEIDVKLRVHNPQALVHHGGKWDLGNENSLYLTKLDCLMQCESNAHSPLSKRLCLTRSDTLSAIKQSASSFSSCSITQHSSGGKNWSSPNHKTKDNRVTLLQQAPSIHIDDQQPSTSETVLRPEPSVFLSNEHGQLSVLTRHFWQKFPSSLSVQGPKLNLSFTHNHTKDAIELQPGEIISHSFTLFIQSEAVDQRLCSPNLRIEQSLLEQANVGVWLSPCLRNDGLQALIDRGIQGENSFFDKREALDEYGWRHFGDIYADHEAAEHDGDDPFVSHYNNQYDPLHGMLKQWLISGDMRWKELADDLFEHLVHIDIYHTTEDKPEYNQGLFWHTDHYLQAETASHRTYSKYQKADAYMDHAGGGGPGAHHCYTSGLVLYYWLSGRTEAFTCMINMANWMKHIYEGDGTLLGLFLRIKNANHVKLPFSHKLLLGHGTGIVRNVFTQAYPFDRGTGNYVNTLLDAFEISQDYQYLFLAEDVICNTISSADDISKRQFDDVENTWFYVVFLQSVVKYLYLITAGHVAQSPRPERLSAIQSAFMHYANYMCENEAPYLSQADKLEYPNDTWTAQDLRKVSILVAAAMMQNTDKKQACLDKAVSLSDWIHRRLAKSEEREYTRILALMMQNYGCLQIYQEISQSSVSSAFNASDKAATSQSATHADRPKWLTRIWQFCKAYSISKERKNLLKRIPKLQKWLGKP